MPKVSGTLYRQGSKERIEGGSVKATKGAAVRYSTADGDGDFELELEPGKWGLVALDDASLPSSPEEVDLATEDKSGIRIYLARLQGTEDLNLGRRLWYGLLIALGLLVVVYIVLHAVFPRQPAPLASTLPALVAQAQDQAEAADKTSASTELRDSVARIKSAVAALSSTGDLADADKTAASGLVEAVRSAVEQDRQTDVVAGLSTLEKLVLPAAKESVGVWDRGPWRFLEVLLWGLAGILVHKIIITGWYLRSQKFYREGIVMHLAHIFTTPLLVLVAVLLLSLATLSITLASGSQLTIDLSDPRILAAVSFLLGSSPWPLWNFVENTAGRITGVSKEE